jgi:hypothetical protein
MYRDYEYAKRVIDTSFSMDHFTIVRRYNTLFRKKYWGRFVGYRAGEFEDLLHEKMNCAMDLYNKLDELYLDHFSDSKRLERLEGEWKREKRDERLEDLLDK